jgi:glucokinase
MPELHHPLLVADIGGTNCRVSLVSFPGAEPKVLHRQLTSGTATPAEALSRAIALAPTKPRAAILAVAGPVKGMSAQLTNAGWSFDAPALAMELGLEQVLLLNDFEALATALPVLKGKDLRTVHKGGDKADGTMLVVGPGTGFGAAALIGRDGRFTIMQTEAGHMELGPVTETEFKLWPYLDRLDGRITIEALLSGNGLLRIDSAMRRLAGRPSLGFDTAGLVGFAQSGDLAAKNAIRHFGVLLARVAGDLALACKATGGVFIAGGVAPKLLPLFDLEAMQKAFLQKAPMGALMEEMPLHIVVGADPAERGLALVAAEPETFGLDHRLWG